MELLECSACPRGKYATNRGQGLCIPCPHRLSSHPGASTCSTCAAGFYLHDINVDRSTLLAAPDQQCLPCPSEGAICGWNTTVETLNLTAGFWRIALSTIDVRPCPTASHCLGGVDIASQCVTGTTGPLCRVCANDFFATKNERCTLCDDMGGDFGGWVPLIVVCCCALVRVVAPPVLPASLARSWHGAAAVMAVTWPMEVPRGG